MNRAVIAAHLLLQPTCTVSVCVLFGVCLPLSFSPSVSFEELMKAPPPTAAQQPQQASQQPDQQQQQQASQQTLQQPDQQQQQPPQQPAPGALVGSFKGSASQVAPIPPHVLDQEYDMMHQVGGWVCGDV